MYVYAVKRNSGGVPLQRWYKKTSPSVRKKFKKIVLSLRNSDTLEDASKIGNFTCRKMSGEGFYEIRMNEGNSWKRVMTVMLNYRQGSYAVDLVLGNGWDKDKNKTPLRDLNTPREIMKEVKSFVSGGKSNIELIPIEEVLL